MHWRKLKKFSEIVNSIWFIEKWFSKVPYGSMMRNFKKSNSLKLKQKTD